MKCDEIFAALAMLEKERGISQTFMMDKIIQALTTAYKRDHDGVENVIVDVDEAHQTLKMYVQKNVVEEEDYVDPANEMTVEEATKRIRRTGGVHGEMGLPGAVQAAHQGGHFRVRRTGMLQRLFLRKTLYSPNKNRD